MAEKQDNVATIKVSLDDESKALLKAHTAALLKGTAPAGGKSKPAADDFENTGGEASGGDDDDFGGGDGDGDDEPSLTQADVQKALRGLAEATDKATAVKLMKAKGGTAALSDLDADKYKTVIDAAVAATKKAKAAK